MNSVYKQLISRKMGIVTGGIPQEITLELSKLNGCTVFIETGTSAGGTTRWAAKHFEIVHTIELSEYLYNQHHQELLKIKGITPHLGDSRIIFPRLVSELGSRRALHWLDGHWSGGVSGGEENECPILEELACLSSRTEDIILIDDARLFLCAPPLGHKASHWPTITEIIEALPKSDNPPFVQIVDDVIFIIPNKEVLRNHIIDYSQKRSSYFWQEFTKFHASTTPVSIPETTPKVALAHQSTYLEQIEVDGEAGVIRNYIEPDQIIFDIGGGVGEWTQAVLDNHKGTQIHLFEPTTNLYPQLIDNLSTAITNKQVIFNSSAVGATESTQKFYYYANQPNFSTLYRSREETEEYFGMGIPEELTVLTTTLDEYCQRKNIKRIHFAKITVEGAELDVLRGAEKLLAKGKIDYLQFEYSGAYLESQISLQQTFAYLQHYQYLVFKVLPTGLEFKPQFVATDEDFQYANYLAVHERFRALVIPDAEKWLDWGNLARHNSINPVEPRGVLHVGAHLGGEVWAYHNMGLKTAVFIEANPEIFPGLEGILANYRQHIAENNLPGIEHLVAVNCAASNENGTVNFRITSSEQSSSILPLKIHSDVYPTIEETHQVEVVSKTLDTLLEELQINPADVNLINFDIQGAELMALQGATNLLKYVDAINTEVSYVELYEGCGLIDDMDDFLEQYGFVRIATTTPYHRTWGDAFYVKRGVITMSCLGNLGRFGNSLLQYVYLKTYAKLYNLRVETPEWIGQYLFGHSDPPISQELPQINQLSSEETCHMVLGGLVPRSTPPFRNIDLYAFVQLTPIYYLNLGLKDYYKSLFQPTPEIEAKVSPLWAKLQARGGTIIGIHLRRGDYIEQRELLDSQGNYHLAAAPSEWYLEWLKGMWPTLWNPILFLTSDSIDDVIGDFAEYNPVTSKDLGADFPEAEFYPDFYLLSKCDLLAISNSSFSYIAALLNENAQGFMRPRLSSKGLISFVPWTSFPVFNENFW